MHYPSTRRHIFTQHNKLWTSTSLVLMGSHPYLGRLFLTSREVQQHERASRTNTSTKIIEALQALPIRDDPPNLIPNLTWTSSCLHQQFATRPGRTLGNATYDT